MPDPSCFRCKGTGNMGFTMFVHCGCEAPKIISISDWNCLGDPPKLLMPPRRNNKKSIRPCSGVYCWLTRRTHLSIGRVKEGKWWCSDDTDNIKGRIHDVELVYKCIGKHRDENRHYELVRDNRENVKL